MKTKKTKSSTRELTKAPAVRYEADCEIKPFIMKIEDLKGDSLVLLSLHLRTPQVQNRQKLIEAIESINQVLLEQFDINGGA